MRRSEITTDFKRPPQFAKSAGLGAGKQGSRKAQAHCHVTAPFFSLQAVNHFTLLRMVDSLGAFPFFPLYLHYGKKAGTTPGKTFGENAPAETDKKQTAMFEPGNKVGVQFQPGESGNPNGRPVGAKSLGVLINKILDGETELVLEDDLNTTDSPQKITLTRREKIWLKIIMDAEDNKDPLMRLRAALALADRTDGKPGQNIDLTSGGDKMQNPLTTLPVEEQAEILRKLIKANDGK